MSSVSNWYVLYTKPRSEKKSSDRLSLEGYEVYCPLIRTLRQWSDRKKKVSVPMFPSYIFIRIDEKRRQEPLVDPGVMNYVYWLGKPAVIREEEIGAIREIESKGSDIVVQGTGFERGQYIEIPEGPFKGLNGTVDKVDNRKVLVYIEQLGCIVQFYYKAESGTVDR